MSSGGGSGSSNQQSTQTVQKADPWVGQQPWLQAGYPIAYDAMMKTPTTPHQGALVAGPNDIQLAANQQTRAVGGNLQSSGQGMQQQGQTVLNNALAIPNLPGNQQGADPSMLTSLGGSRLDVANNPHLMPALMSNIEYGAGKIRDITLPALSSSMGAQGGPSAYGGTRHQQMENQVVNDFSRNATDAIAQATLGAYNTERGIEAGQEGMQFGASAARNQQADSLNMGRSNFLAQLAPQLVGQGVGMQTQGLGLQASAGDQHQGWQQDKLNEALQKYQMSVEAPWQGIKNYSAIIGGAIPGSTVGSNISTLPRQSTISGLAGGAMGGAAMGGALGSIVPGLGTGLGAGAGAILGGLGGFFR